MCVLARLSLKDLKDRMRADNRVLDICEICEVSPTFREKLQPGPEQARHRLLYGPVKCWTGEQGHREREMTEPRDLDKRVRGVEVRVQGASENTWRE